MVITIDGPAGAGKSTIAKNLARDLGYRFLDTGAMYRAVTFLALRERCGWDNVQRLAEIAKEMELSFRDKDVLIGDQNISLDIRSPEVTKHVGCVADQPAVRAEMIRRQREFVAEGDVVTEGRDQGTAAFPDAELKFFLTASAEERANRRQKQLKEQGMDVSFAELLADQNERDERDYNREAGPLVRPDDAVVIDTDGMSIEQVVSALTARVATAKSEHPA